jgi:hypothetical protein
MVIRTVVQLLGGAAGGLADRVLDAYTLPGPPPLLHDAVDVSVGMPGGPVIRVRVETESGRYAVVLDSQTGPDEPPSLLAEGLLTDAL